MSSKITIIGAGSVGATIAYTLSSQDIASELVLIDINKQKAEGEVLDIIQGTCFRDPISIIAGLLHDTVEDGDNVSLTDIEKQFGREVAKLVDGVTKLTRSGKQE